MMSPDIAREAKQAIALIKAFSLELHQYGPESQVMYWLNTYRPAWIRDAIIEAVFQGRYKIISVHHILGIWQRRGQPTCHFTSGFEQVIASHLGSPIHLSPTMMAQPQQGKQLPSPISNYSFAPSPLSSSVMAADSAREALGEDLQPYATDHPHWSIDAFPVEPMDNLVEVYKANTSAKSKLALGGNQGLDINDHDLPAETEDAAELNLRDASTPIQTFRPTHRYEPLAKI